MITLQDMIHQFTDYYDSTFSKYNKQYGATNNITNESIKYKIFMCNLIRFAYHVCIVCEIPNSLFTKLTGEILNYPYNMSGKHVIKSDAIFDKTAALKFCTRWLARSHNLYGMENVFAKYVTAHIDKLCNEYDFDSANSQLI